MPHKPRLRWFDHLTGRQKLVGVVALILAVVVFLNPEFIVLGLAGDTAFFDMLVLALALQGHAMAARAWEVCRMLLRDVARRLEIPSPGLVYMLAALALAVRSLETAIHKLGNWILSQA